MLEIKENFNGFDVYLMSVAKSDVYLTERKNAANETLQELAQYAIDANAEITRQAQRIAILEALLPTNNFIVEYEIVKTGENLASAISEDDARQQTIYWNERAGNKNVRIVKCTKQD